MDQPVIMIVILNWNGWADTRECLASVLKLSGVEVITCVVDNGSVDDTPLIAEYGRRNFSGFIEYDIDQIRGAATDLPPANSLVLIKNHENLGFAKANNIAIQFADQIGLEFIYLLNNDTVVEPDSLSTLFSVLQDENYAAVVPQIRYYKPAEIVWCCGGEVNNFYEYYNYKDQHFDVVPKNKFFDISFATGCALLFKRSQIHKLSEKFFFGEEDFELALRLKRLGKKMACVTGAVIYHKESMSINRSSKFLNKIYVHKLNRMVNMKTYAPYSWPFRVSYRALKFFLMILMRERMGVRRSLDIIVKFCRHSFTLQEINRETFFEIINSDIK